MQDGILSAIGNTPLVRLTRVLKDINFRLYAKLEAFNPGGSTKDRPAFSILKRALDTGHIREGTTIIESSSGNMGIGLAQACAYLGLRFICVVDPKTTAQNIRLLKAYGANVDIVLDPHPETGEYLQARIDRVKELTTTIENSFWPDQYSNLYNPRAHYQTMDEIVSVLGPDIDYVFCATSTCGTMRGCAEYINTHGLHTRTMAVDAFGSVIFGGQKKKRLIPGHGAAIRPPLYQANLADECIYVTDLECVIGCRRLVQNEAIMAGGSSGAVLMAIEQISSRIPRDATCVAIFPDRGERYLDTIYSDTWVLEHFGDVEHMWNETLEVQYA
jgi:N-(2-amino-2-carboxyethyl)-L-glutamate synthase